MPRKPPCFDTLPSSFPLILARPHYADGHAKKAARSISQDVRRVTSHDQETSASQISTSKNFIFLTYSLLGGFGAWRDKGRLLFAEDVIALVIDHHPHRALADFRRKPVRRFAHTGSDLLRS
ncbi:hypothetical protein U5A82_02575 [Sphingobium sp. CR2-8]|uniref:hypothetical protein n=1 Tax=Sphingobium sp. CR2-8 TaxID=1306534 RepID=UPI002DB7D346|nr:hypothetical protein [Sphingobium sp. CR2-8]MEC3909399.1 hypothetical protein [Sphingobium sp. CR2-8]